MCDWRRHFFLNKNGSAFDPQGDNIPGSGTTEGINEALLNGGSLTMSSTTANWQINYPAVLKWIKAGPQTLPPNLRSGRVLYYSSIPDDVTLTTGTTQQILDKVFWTNYINYVIHSTVSTSLYGTGDSWTAGATTSIYTSDLTAWTGPSGTWTNSRPYMRYNDSPTRPRLHMWFGPLSMMDFIASVGTNNWNSGTCHEAQCWQLKAGMQSVLDDVQTNHPNHYVGMTMFASSAYNDMRVSMGQNFTALKNALFYPKSLLTTINAGNTTTEQRPYTWTSGAATTWASVAGDEIPNANGSTDPNTGLAYAFNLLSPSASLPSQYRPTVGGQIVQARRGAAKMMIFETDGVPNCYRGLSSGNHNWPATLKGYDTYYPTSAYAIAQQNSGDPTSMSNANAIVTQFVKQMASTNSSGVDSGLSLPNSPAKLYAIGFGDLFDSTLAPNATFRPTALQFLADLSITGGTAKAGATTVPSYQIITGTYDTRISTLKDCMQRIFQAGVAVTLVE
jgi:hypothetical protein